MAAVLFCSIIFFTLPTHAITVANYLPPTPMSTNGVTVQEFANIQTDTSGVPAIEAGVLLDSRIIDLKERNILAASDYLLWHGSVFMGFRFRPTTAFENITNVVQTMSLYHSDTGYIVQDIPFFTETTTIPSLLTEYPVTVYDTMKQIRIPFSFNTRNSSIIMARWDTIQPIWFTVVISMDRASHNGDYNTVEWIASPPISLGSTISHGYAIRDKTDILGQGWVHWTPASPYVNNVFLIPSDTNMLCLHMEVEGMMDPIVVVPITPNTTTTPNTTKPEPTTWLPYVPEPYIPPPFRQVPAPLANQKMSFFSLPLVFYTISLVTAGVLILGIIYTTGRRHHYSREGSVGMYFSDLIRGFVDTSIPTYARYELHEHEDVDDDDSLEDTATTGILNMDAYSYSLTDYLKTRDLHVKPRAIMVDEDDSS